MRVGHSLFLAAARMIGSRPAWADCLLVEEFTRQLADDYHEAPIAHAVQDGLPIVVFASAGGKTWTAIVIVKGQVCTLAAGTDWTAAPAGDKS